MYEKIFSHTAELGKVRDRFAEYMAGLAVTSSINPLKSGWLDRFMLASQEQDRRSWASHVRRFLSGANDAARTTAWQKWVRDYWNRRILGLPVKLDTVELGEMVEWSLSLATVFPEVAEMISKGPKFEVKEFILRELADTSLPNSHPKAAAQFLLKILQNMTVAYFDLDKVEEVVKRILPLGAPKELLRAICGELARLGSPGAGDLQSFINA